MEKIYSRSFVILLTQVILIGSKPLPRNPVGAGGQAGNVEQLNNGLNGPLGNVGLQQNIPGQIGHEIMRPVGQGLNDELAHKARQQFQDAQPLGNFQEHNPVKFVQEPVLQRNIQNPFLQQPAGENLNNPELRQPQQNIHQPVVPGAFAQHQQNNVQLPMINQHINRNVQNPPLVENSLNLNPDNIQGQKDVNNENVLQGAPQAHMGDSMNGGLPQVVGANQMPDRHNPLQHENQQGPQHMQVAPPNDRNVHNQDADVEQVMQLAPAEAQPQHIQMSDGAGDGEDNAQEDQQIQKPGNENVPQQIPQAEPQPVQNRAGQEHDRRDAEGPVPQPQRGEGLGFHPKSLHPLKMDKLQPPDHMEGVRMEQDGHLNKDYRKEIFLGHGHESFEQISEAEVKKKLKNIFTLADINADGFMTATELEDWIILKVKEHFDQAGEENESVFKALDTDNDGYITWQEFQVQFLMARGMTAEEAQQHNSEIDNIPVSRKDKDLLVHYRFHWSDADATPSDNRLDMEEFQSFRHPESSVHTTGRMIKDIVENLDSNRDGIITEEEFVALPPGEVVEEEWRQADQIWVEERRKEFKTSIDLNSDGKVDMQELQKYVDPQNPNHAKVEAQNLIQMADNDKDGKLSLSEVLDNMDLFLGSKMVDTARSFHDEF